MVAIPQQENDFKIDDGLRHINDRLVVIGNYLKVQSDLGGSIQSDVAYKLVLDAVRSNLIDIYTIANRLMKLQPAVPDDVVFYYMVKELAGLKSILEVPYTNDHKYKVTNEFVTNLSDILAERYSYFDRNATVNKQS